jgi:hypothetical protein
MLKHDDELRIAWEKAEKYEEGGLVLTKDPEYTRLFNERVNRAIGPKLEKMRKNEDAGQSA